MAILWQSLLNEGENEMRTAKKIVAVVLVLSVLLPTACASDDLSTQLSTSGTYLLQTVASPQISDVGGEWAVIGLARSGLSIPTTYWEGYYSNVVEVLQTADGVLHEKKYTEYARVVLALTAIGVDPTDVDGYDIISPLEDYDSVVWQGINGAIWAVITLSCGGDTTSSSIEGYLEYILDYQLADGGWALTGSVADPDLTGMALQALSFYQEEEAVGEAVERALTCMSLQQNENGGYTSWGSPSIESVVQMIVALCSLEIPLDDVRFVKNGNTLWDSLMEFSLEDGSFSHQEGGVANGMATEQAFYAIAALQRAQQGKPWLYDMTDSTALLEGDEISRGEFTAKIVALLGLELEYEHYFHDVDGDDWRTPYIAAAASCGLVNGIGEGNFAPDQPITNQEVAVILSRAAQMIGLDSQMEEQTVTEILDGIQGGDQVAQWARSQVAFCYQMGLFVTEDSPLIPTASASKTGMDAILETIS